SARGEARDTVHTAVIGKSERGIERDAAIGISGEVALERLTIRVADQHGGDRGVLYGENRVDGLVPLLLINDDGDRSRGLGVVDFGIEEARAALHQRDAAGERSRGKRCACESVIASG